jgi:hypothetical protein
MMSTLLSTMKSIVYYTYPPASLSVDHALGNLRVLVQQATLVIGRRHTHRKDRVVGRCILAQAVLGVCQDEPHLGVWVCLLNVPNGRGDVST